MSLLMEALRKAEDAKRRAAQSEKLEEAADNAASSTGTEKSAEPASADTENWEFESWSPDPEVTPTAAEIGVTESVEELTLEANNNNIGNSRDRLDIPLDFSLDDISLEPIEVTPEEPEIDLREKSSEDTESIRFDQEINPVENSSSAQDDYVEENNRDLEVNTAAERRIEIVKEPEPAIAPATEPLLELTERAPAEEVIPEAVHSNTAHSSAEETAQTEDKESRKEKSLAEARSEQGRRTQARSVFSAKTPQKGQGKGKKLALVAVLVLLPLAGASIYFTDGFGMLSGGSQFNIPVANLDIANRQWPESDLSGEGAALTAVDGTETPAPDTLDLSLVATGEETPAQPASPDTSVSEVAVDTAAAATVQTEVPGVANAITENTPVEIESSVVAVQEDVAASVVADTVISSQANTQETAAVVPVVAQTNPINITRSTVVPQIAPQLHLAYGAFQAGDFIDARALYQQVLRNEPGNRDAMLGLAAVALRTGDNASARQMYTQLLNLDSRDAFARAGLLATVPASDPIALESELKQLFDQNPNVAPLAFALGNLFASQQRWNEAQQAYYDALLSAKANTTQVSPDYAFNLAISLERLNQLRPAQTYYREALEVSRTIQPSFNVEILHERIRHLESVLP